jgi:hypothetical protein
VNVEEGKEKVKEIGASCYLETTTIGNDTI